MRLRKIRLAGFKSFVDPTTITLPSDLVGVVGPNGCGKSNVIDAVRWVMGEISAKHLRGDTMADVVFTGSSTRSPVSQASVELLFDNSEGRASGRFAAYAEISVKREVGRDGHSSYYLNGVRCRRRDVMDLFLGTGLGPRSYAVIEQGMISRVVEAKPEDLREFLEEAAGISKYKERRRETENRIRHTRENLDRLSDLREELGKRLAHLKRQATMAEKYKLYKEEERSLNSELEALRWRELDGEATAQAARIGTQQTRLEAVVAEQRKLEARIEKQREAHAEATEHFNAVYRRVLDAGAAIARSEQTIQNLRSREQQIATAARRESERLEVARAQSRSEDDRLTELRAALGDGEPELARLQDVSARARLAFREAEEAYLEWQTQGEALNERAAEPSRTKHAEEARIEQLEQALARMRQQLGGWASAGDGEADDGPSAALAALEQDMASAVAALEQAEDGVQARQRELRELRNRSHAEADALHEARETFQALRGRVASLEALQQAALGKDREALSQWLQRLGLGDAPRLAECIEVDPAWERAVESVLDRNLEAVRVERLDDVTAALADVGEGGLSLLERGAGVAVAHSGGELTPLADHVGGSVVPASLLAGSYAATSLEAALASRGALAAHERLVTPEGVQVGRDWLRVPQRDAGEAGVIARERALHALGAQLETLERDVNERTARAEATREQLHAAEEEVVAAQAELSHQQMQRASVQARLGELRAQRAQAVERAAERAQQMQELEARIAAEEHVLARARERLQASDAEMSRLSGERASWESARDARRRRMEQARDRWHESRDESYDLGLKVEATRVQLASLQEARARSGELIAQLEQRGRELEEERRGLVAPLEEVQNALQRQLTQRREVEEQLASARGAVEAADEELRAMEQSRIALERRVSAEREALEGLRIAGQEILVRRKTIEEQLQKHGFDVADVLERLGDDASVAVWEDKLEAIERRIGRLGPINLAAIDEYDQQSERKTYLDAQHADLEEALATLQAAIQKIDRETRARFKETYEKVNNGMQRLFPRLFGGGNAELEMTGDDLLSAGISVVARPPGKRNTSIHLLSGGEKALTAVALVFAIFELNPAPFCLLDEVDAPLDDNNVGRFCELLKDKAEQVQFLIVTHNKITMEIAQQLIGVTMNEPGVSRLVAVDIDEAVEMAAA